MYLGFFQIFFIKSMTTHRLIRSRLQKGDVHVLLHVEVTTDIASNYVSLMKYKQSLTFGSVYISLKLYMEHLRVYCEWFDIFPNGYALGVL